MCTHFQKLNQFNYLMHIRSAGEVAKEEDWRRYFCMDAREGEWCLIISEEHLHGVKKRLYSEFFWLVISHNWNEYRDLPRKSPYSVRMRENANQKNSNYRHFLRSVKASVSKDFLNCWSKSRYKPFALSLLNLMCFHIHYNQN